MRIHLQVHDLDVPSGISQGDGVLSWQQVIFGKDLLVQLGRECALLWAVQVEALQACGWGNLLDRVRRDLLGIKGTILIGREW